MRNSGGNRKGIGGMEIGRRGAERVGRRKGSRWEGYWSKEDRNGDLAPSSQNSRSASGSSC